jgi:hypothetical protein
VSNRSEAWNGLKQDLLPGLEKAKTYHFSAWVKLENTDEETLRLSMRQVIGSDVTTSVIGSVQATNSAFSLIEGDYTVADSDAITALEIMVNGASSGVSFYVDHVRVYTYRDPFIVASVFIDNGSFSLSWNADLGASYRIEQSLTLEENDWTVVENAFVADKSQIVWPIPQGNAEQRVFWRVVKNS